VGTKPVRLVWCLLPLFIPLDLVLFITAQCNVPLANYTNVVSAAVSTHNGGYNLLSRHSVCSAWNLSSIRITQPSKYRVVLFVCVIFFSYKPTDFIFYYLACHWFPAISAEDNCDTFLLAILSTSFIIVLCFYVFTFLSYCTHWLYFLKLFYICMIISFVLFTFHWRLLVSALPYR